MPAQSLSCSSISAQLRQVVMCQRCWNLIKTLHWHYAAFSFSFTEAKKYTTCFNILCATNKVTVLDFHATHTRNWPNDQSEKNSNVWLASKMINLPKCETLKEPLICYCICHTICHPLYCDNLVRSLWEIKKDILSFTHLSCYLYQMKQLL